MPENEKIRIDLSADTKGALVRAQRRQPRRSAYDHVQDAAATVAVVTFFALATTAMVWAILWLLEQMPPLP